MRVVYADASERAELERDITSFWTKLAAKIRAGKLDQAGGLCAELDDRLAFEASRSEDERLVCSVRALEPEALPIAERVVAHAPRDLPARVTATRPRLSFQHAVQRVQERTGVDLSRARARAGFARGHSIDVAVFIPGGGRPREPEAANEMLDFLLGEDLRRDFIGEVRTAATPKGGLLKVLDNRTEQRSFPLEELPDAVNAAVEGLYSGLPEEPWWASRAEPEYVMFELEVEQADDYSAQDDCALASSCAPEMLHCALRRASFSSRRFSRHSEIFAYLKYGAGTDLARAIEARDSLEAEVDRALVDARAGRVVGRGIGLKYAYLHLALSDVARAAELLRLTCRKRALPERSWLLFCDSHLGDEWIGLHPSAPEPP